MTTTAQTTTPLHEGGPYCEAFAMPDGPGVNVHFVAGDEQRTYALNTVEQVERFIESLHRACPAARRAQ